MGRYPDSVHKSYNSPIRIQIYLYNTRIRPQDPPEGCPEVHARSNRKQKRKRKTATPDDGIKRPPSGFAKPALISDELCCFLGTPSGTEMARTEVTKLITSYIKEHNLQNAANKREIAPDAKLKNLLNINKGDVLTFFNLQKYMKVHFPKTAASTASA